MSNPERKGRLLLVDRCIPFPAFSVFTQILNLFLFLDPFAFFILIGLCCQCKSRKRTCLRFLLATSMIANAIITAIIITISIIFIIWGTHPEWYNFSGNLGNPKVFYYVGYPVAGYMALRAFFLIYWNYQSWNFYQKEAQGYLHPSYPSSLYPVMPPPVSPVTFEPVKQSVIYAVTTPVSTASQILL